uniref:Uncharacterized protein n=1 Tax=viral metagenome TaxID=1070528 RepID=A0A6C0KGK4_9ZZZZ
MTTEVTVPETGFVSVHMDNLTPWEDFESACIQCGNYECIVAPSALIAVASTTALLFVTNCLASVWFPGANLVHVPKQRSSWVVHVLLLLVAVMPVMILVTDTRESYHVPRELAHRIVWTQPHGEGTQFGCYPRYTELSASEPFLSTDRYSTDFCSADHQCWHSERKRFVDCPGEYAGISDSTENHLIPDAPWFLMGNYHWCGKPDVGLGACPDFEGRSSVLVKTESSHDGRTLLVCKTTG